MLLYAAIAAFGLLFLLAMLFVGDLFGGDHDAHFEVHGHDAGDAGHGPSIFSARIMASFMTAFGAGGAIARYFGLPQLASSGIGIASGVVMAGIVYQFAKALYGQQASSEVRMHSLVGRTAEVTVGIPEGGVGQITITIAGERSTHIARPSDGKPIGMGSEVVITGLRGDSVIVERAAPPAPGATS
jgi:membrane protein implicated in regulation of membrane protease activity